jgi:peptide-methionine (S)-S-oxide reductase
VRSLSLAAVLLLALPSLALADGPARAAAPQDTAVAIFAGGCFWCMEPPFDELPGVISTTSGYTGGHVANPSYEAVSAGRTGHAEVVEIRYDPSQIGYAELLDVFWHNIDPFAKDRQFCDRGSQYRSAIFYLDAEQERLARASAKRVAAELGAAVATEITAAAAFYPAEDYHQDYYRKNPLRYKYYRFSCGRDQRLAEIWGSD